VKGDEANGAADAIEEQDIVEILIHWVITIRWMSCILVK
jgi:hypothetical protein